MLRRLIGAGRRGREVVYPGQNEKKPKSDSTTYLKNPGTTEGGDEKILGLSLSALQRLLQAGNACDSSIVFGVEALLIYISYSICIDVE